MGNIAKKEVEGSVNGSKETFEMFFAARAREGVLLGLPVIGALHAFTALAYWFTTPYEQAMVLSLFSICVTCAALAADRLLRATQRLKGTDGLALGVVLLALCNALLHLAGDWSPLAVAAAAILLAAVGGVATSRVPLLVAPVATHVWWALLASADGWGREWFQFEAALLAATLLSWGVYYLRRQTARQLFDGQEQMQMQAQRDPLTLLPIRPAMVDRMAESFSREKRNADRRFAVCILNLDGFQKVNEEHGHSGGDLLLQTVAERLRQGARKSDFVARLGGDEFVLLLDEIPTREHAEAAADRLCGLSCAPVDLDGVTVELSASFGVVWSGDGYESEEAMLKAAQKELQAAQERYKSLAKAIEQHKSARPGAAGAGLPLLA